MYPSGRTISAWPSYRVGGAKNRFDSLALDLAPGIILVDFTKRLWLEGREPVEAALHAARLRLRPILITSLTSIFGMMPIALGLGEGGKILQPLGIAVSGGLWISMLLTLLIVPLLQVQHLTHSKRLSI